MFTDVSFTCQRNSFGKRLQLGLFQKNCRSNKLRNRLFKVIKQCPSGWSHTVRISWDLSFRLITSHGNTTGTYRLVNAYKQERKKHMLSKKGTVTVQQGYGNGKQIIEFEQVRGKPIIGVQIYRGKLLVDEQFFTNKSLMFQVDSLIGISEVDQEDAKNIDSHDPAALVPTGFEIDLTGKKSIHITVNQNSATKFAIDKLENW